MPVLVTIPEAKLQLRITTPHDDPGDIEIALHFDLAEAAVIGYCNRSAWWRAITPTWTAATVPLEVKAAILIHGTEFYRFRGDEVAGEGPSRTTEFDLSLRVRELLRGFHDPVVA
jgi:hypothetical protein